jgi:hypothetical protein
MAATKKATKNKPSRNPVGSRSVTATKKPASKPKAPAPPPKTKRLGRPGYEDKIDWEAVERDYRTGKFTDVELSKKYSIARQSIIRHRNSAKAAGTPWLKDLAVVVRQATSAAVIAASVQEGVKNVTDTVAAIAQGNAEVILGHRSDIKDLRSAAWEMLGELQAVGGTMHELREFLLNLESLEIGAISADEDLGQKEKDRRIKRLQDEYDRIRKMTFEAADIHNRIGSAKALADTLVKLQTLERKAFGLDDDPTGGKETYEKVLDSVLE